MRFVELVYEYNVLRLKAEDPNVSLDAEEKARLDRLDRLLRGELPADERRRMSRVRCGLPVELSLSPGLGTGRLRDISGQGMGLETEAALPLGATVLVHVADQLEEVEYLFPARVVWRRDGGEGGTGLTFVGMPSRAALVREVA